MLTTIDDVRPQNAFTKASFSNYKKTDVLRELTKSLVQSDVNSACFWVSECVCSGYFLDIWTIIITFSCEYIHSANPRLFICIHKYITNFKSIANTFDADIMMRNTPSIRKIFSELIVIICSVNRPTKYVYNKVSDADLSLNNMSNKFTATSTKYAEAVFIDNDPKELYMPLNEFSYHLNPDSASFNQACYWYEIMIRLYTVCKKQKNRITCVRRPYIPIKVSPDGLWIVWEPLLNAAEQKGKGTKALLDSLLSIFTLRYTSSSWTKYRFLIYFAITIATSPIDFSIPLTLDKPRVSEIASHIDVIYSKLKNNEVNVKHNDVDRKMNVYMML